MNGPAFQCVSPMSKQALYSVSLTTPFETMMASSGSNHSSSDERFFHSKTASVTFLDIVAIEAEDRVAFIYSSFAFRSLAQGSLATSVVSRLRLFAFS
jgi:hypothetical protein